VRTAVPYIFEGSMAQCARAGQGSGAQASPQRVRTYEQSARARHTPTTGGARALMPGAKSTSARMASPAPAPASDGAALLAAVEAGDEAAVAELLAAGADPNAQRLPLCATWNKAPVSLGPTALMGAMRRGHDGIAKRLLAANADPLVMDQFDKTAAMIALEYGHIHMQSIVMIIQQTPSKKLLEVDKWGHSLIMYAALAGAASIVELLLKGDNWAQILGARVNDGDHENLDVLTLTAKHGQGKVIQVLLRAQYRPTLLRASLLNAATGAQEPVDKGASLDVLSKSQR
jgi:hypothetical protein